MSLNWRREEGRQTNVLQDDCLPFSAVQRQKLKREEPAATISDDGTKLKLSLTGGKWRRKCLSFIKNAYLWTIRTIHFYISITLGKLITADLADFS